MEYCYTGIYWIKGLTLTPGERDKELILDTDVGMRAILTPRPNSNVVEADRSNAVKNLMIRGLLHSEKIKDGFKQRVSDTVEEIRAAREKRFGNGPFLVFIGKGEVQSFKSSKKIDTKDFIICLDATYEGETRARYVDKITALINSITSEIESVIGIKKLSDSTVFFCNDGKPIYTFSLSFEVVGAYVSEPLSMEQVKDIEKSYELFNADSTLQRVQKLIRSSLESEKDKLRSFLAAWTAFEIFVNKSFQIYEQRLFKSMLEDEPPEVKKEFILRIRKVMDNKYRFGDRFRAISFQLSTDTADEDMKIVKEVKNIRDKLVHGGSVDEDSLPVKNIRNLASKYLRLHLREEAEQKT